MSEQLVHSYEPVGSARELFLCKDPEILLSGPAGTGKSRACLEKLHILMLKYPGARGLVARKTATSLTSTALATFKEFVAKEALLSGEVKFYGGSSGDPSSFRYGNGSVIVIAGLDKATRIMSSEYDIAYIQEAIELTENDWESISTRLRHGVIPYQQMIADTNPDSPYHWLKQRCDNTRTRIIYCQHEDNPMLWNRADKAWTPAGAEYIRRLDDLTGIRLDRLRFGRWSAAEGLVYDTWDSETHLYKSMIRPPKDWERLWSIDFGFTNPFVCQFWAKDPDGRLFLYREVYRTQTLVEDHVEAIRKLMHNKAGADPMPSTIVCDHDAEGRATIEEKLGVSTIAARKNVLEGIEAVKARLKVQPDGRPRLFICRDAVVHPDQALIDSAKPASTQQEILSYVWSRQSERGTGAPKEMPLKRDDHGMDAMRYLVSQVDLVGKPNVRWIDLR